MDIILTKLFAHHSLCLSLGLSTTTTRDRELLERIRLCSARSLLTDMNEQGGDLSLRARLRLCKYLSGTTHSSLLARFWDSRAWGLNIPINSNVTRMKCQLQNTSPSHREILSGNFVRELSSSRNNFIKWFIRLHLVVQQLSGRAGLSKYPPSSQLDSSPRGAKYLRPWKSQHFSHCNSKGFEELCLSCS